MIYDKSAMAGLNHCEETGGSARGGGPPVLLKLWAQREARHSQLVVLGYFLRDEAKRGTQGEMERLLLSSLSRSLVHMHTDTHVHTHAGADGRRGEEPHQSSALPHYGSHGNCFC